MLQLQFVCAHELGHLFHGHNDRSALYEEFSRTPAMAPSANQLKRQARETEADGYATKFLLENFLLTDSGQQIHRRLGSSLSREECILTLIVISAGAVFLCLPFSKFAQEAAKSNRYPFGLARLNEVPLQIIPWCEENQIGRAHV